MTHSCIDHLEPRENESRNDGEPCYDERWECVVCRKWFTEEEAARMIVAAQLVEEHESSTEAA